MQDVLAQHCVFGRIGGEEFAAFLPRQGRVQAQQTAEILRQRIAELEFGSGPNQDTSLQVTVSVGVAVIRADGETLDQSLARADRALYLAKHSGRNRVEIAASA